MILDSKEAEEIKSDEFSDCEIDGYICRDEQEIERRRKKWEYQNEEWLEKQKTKELIRKQKEVIAKEMLVKFKNRNKKPSVSKFDSTLSDNQIVNFILNQKKKTKNIDTSVVAGLFDEVARNASKSVHNQSVKKESVLIKF